MACLYLMRHASSQSDGGRRYLGQTDPLLSAEGRRQAGACRDRLRSIGFSRIVSSDLRRAHQTAETIAGGSLGVEAIAALREIHLGAWENRTFGEIRRSHPDQWHARGNDLAGFRPPGGESFEDLRRRVVPAVRAIMESAAGNVLAVAHAGVNRVLLCDLLEIPLQRLFGLAQDPTGLNIIDFAPSEPRVLVINLAPEVLARAGWLAADDTNVPYPYRIQP